MFIYQGDGESVNNHDYSPIGFGDVEEGSFVSLHSPCRVLRALIYNVL